MSKSLKTISESHAIEGLQKTSQFKIDPKSIIIEEGFNARPINKEHVESIKLSYKNGAVLPPLFVRVDNGTVILVDGHHRLQAMLELIDEGEDIKRVDIMEFKGNSADRIALMLTSASGLPLTPLEAAQQYKKLYNFGWTMQEIAAKVGKTQGHISQALQLTELNPELQQSISEGKISTTLAAQNPQLGKLDQKVTAKDLGQYSLARAIQIEIDTQGKVRAETLCQKYAELIAYLRSTENV